MTRLLLIGWFPVLLTLQEPARALYLEGRDHLLEERYEQATGVFRRLVSEFADSEEADDAEYYLGYAYEQLGRDEEAIEAFSSVIERWPDSVRVESAREHRAELVARRGRNDLSREVIDDIFGTASSWELKRDTAFALARQGNLAGRDVLEEAMERESSSRQNELIRILAPHVSNPEARGILILALDRSRSTSVTLRALKALEPVSAQEEVTAAFERLLASGFSTSVKLEAIRTLSPRLDVTSVRRAVSRGLDPGNASSVQLLACATLGRHLLSPEVRPAVLRVFLESYSTSVQLRCLESLAPMRNDFAAADILHQAVAGADHSSAVKLRAVQIAASSTEPQVRAAARAALSREVSTSVQIPAVRALAEGRNEPAAARALEDLFAQDGISTSVLLAALESLAHHMETDAAPSALERALTPENSTSVQLKAIDVAAPHIARAPVRRAVSGALRSDNSTSVLLKAVQALGSQTAHEDVRAALAATLHDGYSTSVVLASMAVLDEYVDSDEAVKRGFIRLMEDGQMSSTARVRAGRRLLSSADASLRERIADAMEDVVVRARRHGISGHRELIEEALDVLEAADPARRESLRGRS